MFLLCPRRNSAMAVRCGVTNGLFVTSTPHALGGKSVNILMLICTPSWNRRLSERSLHSKLLARNIRMLHAELLDSLESVFYCCYHHVPQPPSRNALYLFSWLEFIAEDLHSLFSY